MIKSSTCVVKVLSTKQNKTAAEDCLYLTNSTKNFLSSCSHMLERRLYFSGLVNHPGLAVSRSALWQTPWYLIQYLKLVSLKLALHRNHLWKYYCKVSSLKVLPTFNMARQFHKHIEDDSKVLKLWAKLTNI